MLGIPLLTDYIHKVIKPEDVADSVDYLNYYCTSMLLALAALAISAKQYFGSPIQCWVPMEFRGPSLHYLIVFQFITLTISFEWFHKKAKSLQIIHCSATNFGAFIGGWEKYAEDYCFIQNSYYVPFEEQIPEELHERRDQLSYYRWVPIVLALQALMFFAPNFFWNMLYKQTAVQPRGIVKEAQKCTRLCGTQRESEVHNLAEYISDSISTFSRRDEYEKREVHPLCVAYFLYFQQFSQSGRNLALLYLCTKLFYVANIIGQLYMMNHFLGGDYLYWGYETFMDVATGKEWADSPIFPRVIMCDFQVRRLANLQRHTVQCVIMMNMINEKLYLFLWFWFIFVGICTVVNFLYYVFVMGIPHLRTRLVLWNVNNEQMKLAGLSKSELIRFVHDFLHPDGVLILKFVNEHVSGRVARELVHDLIRIYAKQGFDKLAAVFGDLKIF
ncbi:unnamed protein product [Toxocara canis]|uniref:Innexin n=1 Tax=Toxocara canis TaxID=6265 RepID=A0A183V7N3_TOXCA|nr:unnamed protein product [Toxocara canis]